MNTTIVLYHTKPNGSKLYLYINDEMKKAVLAATTIHQQAEKMGYNFSHNDGRIDYIKALQSQSKALQSPKQDDSSPQEEEVVEGEETEDSSSRKEESILDSGEMKISIVYESNNSSRTQMDITDTPKNAMIVTTMFIKYFEEQVV